MGRRSLAVLVILCGMVPGVRAKDLTALPTLDDLAGLWCLREGTALNRDDVAPGSYRGQMELYPAPVAHPDLTGGEVTFRVIDTGDWARQSLVVNRLMDGSIVARGEVEESGPRGWYADTLRLYRNPDTGELVGHGLDTEGYLFSYVFQPGGCDAVS